MPNSKTQSNGSAKKKSGKKNPQRTREISVVEESGQDLQNPRQNSTALEEESPLLKVTHQQQGMLQPANPDQPVQPEPSFQLGVQVPHAANEVIKKSKKNRPSIPEPKPAQSSPAYSSAPTQSPKSSSLSIKIWNTLEWLATSALIFMVLFFVINFDAYSTLFIDKLNQIRGTVQTNPFIQSLTNQGATQQTQQLLPITATADQSKKQIPYLNLEVAPPDDRVIIPRINRNVPVVKVSAENLIKRDWSALEADIQQALRYGVVHYPGTAEPGENGNVVITGHSSYFSWDPGRFKDVFALLHEVVVGDTVIVYHNQKKYFYQVYQTQVVTPDKVDILTQRGENRLTLITCTPVGTNLKRLIVFARPTDS